MFLASLYRFFCHCFSPNNKKAARNAAKQILNFHEVYPTSHNKYETAFSKLSASQRIFIISQIVSFAIRRVKIILKKSQNVINYLFYIRKCFKIINGDW